MSNLLIPGRPWLFLPRLARLVGVREAIILQQLYWIMQDAGITSITLGHEDWCDLFDFFKPRTMRRLVDSLVERQLLTRKPRDGARSVYQINVHTLSTLAANPGQSGQPPWPNCHTNPGQSGHSDLLIKEILKRDIYPLSGDESKSEEVLEGMGVEQLLVTWWNGIAKDAGLIIALPVHSLTPHVSRVIEEGILDRLADLAKALRTNPYYSGANDLKWVATLQWLLRNGKWQQVCQIGQGASMKPVTFKKAVEHCEQKGHSTNKPGCLFDHIPGTQLWQLKP